MEFGNIQAEFRGDVFDRAADSGRLFRRCARTASDDDKVLARRNRERDAACLIRLAHGQARGRSAALGLLRRFGWNRGRGVKIGRYGDPRHGGNCVDGSEFGLCGARALASRCL